MLERTTVRLAPLTNRAVAFAPVAPACCNICRTCTTTNVIGLGIAAVTGAGYGVARLVKRLGGYDRVHEPERARDDPQPL